MEIVDLSQDDDDDSFIKRNVEEDEDIVIVSETIRVSSDENSNKTERNKISPSNNTKRKESPIKEEDDFEHDNKENVNASTPCKLQFDPIHSIRHIKSFLLSTSFSLNRFFPIKFEFL